MKKQTTKAVGNKPARRRVQRLVRSLRPHEEEVLNYLQWFAENRPQKWVRPMDVGGSDGSHHSGTLAKLVKLGYAESRRRCASIVGALGSNRAGKEYRALNRPNELKLSRGYLRARLRWCESTLITKVRGNKPGSRRLQRLVRCGRGDHWTRSNVPYSFS